jgi:hypothetical protein
LLVDGEAIVADTRRGPFGGNKSDVTLHELERVVNLPELPYRIIVEPEIRAFEERPLADLLGMLMRTKISLPSKALTSSATGLPLLQQSERSPSQVTALSRSLATAVCLASSELRERPAVHDEDEYDSGAESAAVATALPITRGADAEPFVREGLEKIVVTRRAMDSPNTVS